MILLTGGSGLLGTELQKNITFEAPPRDLLDIVKDVNLLNPNRASAWRNVLFNRINLIVHCAAFTNLVLAESEKQLCYETNVIGTRNLASLGIPMLYISTEYVFDGEKGNYAETDYPNPTNFYALTKLLGEYESRNTHSKVIRCLFKSRPFKHEHACTDQFTTGDYVDTLAKEISIAIKIFDKLPATIHIGTQRKSTYDLARQSRDVSPCRIEDIKTVKLPKDTSLNTSAWERIKSENNRLCAL